MGKRELAPDFTADRLDRKTARNNSKILRHASIQADGIAIFLLQRLLDRNLIEVEDVHEVQKSLADELKTYRDLDDFEIRYRVAPIRNIVPTTHLLTLLLTQYITEELLDHPNVVDVYGADLDVYRETLRSLEDYVPSARPKRKPRAEKTTFIPSKTSTVVRFR